jgi:hypothetical protein
MSAIDNVTASIRAVSGPRDIARSTDYRSALVYCALCGTYRLRALLNCKILKDGEIICDRLIYLFII